MTKINIFAFVKAYLTLIMISDELPIWMVTEYPIFSFSQPVGLGEALSNFARDIETPYAMLVDGNEILALTPTLQQCLNHQGTS